MEHADVLELIQVAATESVGLARLTAGDTPEAAAVAGHLAGCAACADELARTTRTVGAVHETVRELPDPALRARTLAFIREVGVERSATGRADANPSLMQAPAMATIGASMAASTAPSPVEAAESESSPLPAIVPPQPAPRRRAFWWAAASIAAVLVAGLAGFAAGGAARVPGTAPDAALAMAAAQITMHIAEQPDAVHVALSQAAGGMAKGMVIYSATSGELSMTVTGLADAPAGSDYACWVLQDGQRRRLGLLYIEGHDGTWAGSVGGFSALGPHAQFGVSLGSPDGQTGDPVLTGG